MNGVTLLFEHLLMPDSSENSNFVALPEWTVYVFINPFIIRTHYLYGYYPFIWKLINMTVQDYLLRISQDQFP